jgi:hypothetical protein
MMACIVWELPGGETYLVAEGEAHIPPLGAKHTGKVKWDCGESTPQDEVDEMLEKQGIPWGSAIKWATSKVGISQCSRCKAREEILNHARELGWAETLRQIKETF